MSHAQGPPETVVYLPSGESLVCLHILGLRVDTNLGIRLSRAGVPLTCAVVTELVISTGDSR